MVSEAARSAAQQAADAAAAAPIPAAAVAAGAVIAPLVIRSQRFRGSGSLIEPAEAINVLQASYSKATLPQGFSQALCHTHSWIRYQPLVHMQREDAVLIDIRDNDVRQRAGVPALDRGALGKGAAVPFRRLPADLARRCGHLV